MMQSDGRPVRGFLADADTGTGLGGLTVELWSAHGSGSELIAEGQSDDTGFFGFAVGGEQFADRDFLDIELRVLDAGRQIATDVRPLSATGYIDPIELSVPRAPQSFDAPRPFFSLDDDPEPPTARAGVSGRIRGTVPPGVKARAVVKTDRKSVV